MGSCGAWHAVEPKYISCEQKTGNSEIQAASRQQTSKNFRIEVFFFPLQKVWTFFFFFFSSCSGVLMC